MLPDDALLTVFDFCADVYEIEAWQTLVHVCRRWRRVVFGSPRRLKLRLVCTFRTPARDVLDIWPPLPLAIRCGYSIGNVDNIVAVLERGDRVGQIDLRDVSSSNLEHILAAMHGTFPRLAYLRLTSRDRIDETVPVLPDSFSGGSAPHLRYLWLERIPFPGLPKLLLSATRLVNLDLRDIPHSGYFSPQAMATALSAGTLLTSLRSLRLEFQSPRSRPDPASRCPPPPTRFVLPVLTEFWFKGVSEYLDDLVAQIDVPRLNFLDIDFFNQIIFDTPQFIQFISRTPALKALEEARVTFRDGAATVYLSPKTSFIEGLEVTILCRELDWQVSSLEQVCTLCLPPLSMLEDLYISEASFWVPEWPDNIENGLWLELLHAFAFVKNLYLSEEFARRIVPVLQELIVGGRTIEVWPTLGTIFLEGHHPSGPVQEGIGQFVATRQVRVTSHPIAVSHWDRSSYQHLRMGRFREVIYL